MKVYRKRLWAQTTITSGVLTETTTSAVSTGYAGLDAAIFQLAVTVASGTVPTLDVIVQDSIDDVNYHTIATFTQRTTTGIQAIRVNGPFGNTVRVVSTITGTTPSFTSSVLAQGQNNQASA